jgi:hypothetical protein
MTGNTDSNWAGSVDDRNSTTGYVFSLITGAVSWARKDQHVVSLFLLQRQNIGQQQN